MAGEQGVQKSEIIKASARPSTERWIMHNRDSLTEERAESVLRAQEHADLIRHRAYWSFALMFVVVALNIFSMTIIASIGLGYMKFAGDAAVPSVIAANFIETWALTRLAMQFYFDKTGTTPRSH
jgi:hypothetical protein